MEYIIGIILLFMFFGLAYYCIKGHNLMIGFLIITLIWTILPLGGTLFASQAFLESNPVLQFEGAKGLVGILNKIYQSAPEGWNYTGKRMLGCMVWSCSDGDRNCVYPDS